MAEVHGVLGRFLRMSREPDAPEFHFAPVGARRRRFRKLPLRRPSAAAPPGKNQTENFARLEDPQSGGPGRRRAGRGNALAGDIVLEAVERADKATVAHPASGFGAQIGAQMRADRFSDTDVSILVAPDDDPFAKPGFPEQLFFLYRLAAGDSFSIVLRLAMKYQPSGNGESKGRPSGSFGLVFIWYGLSQVRWLRIRLPDNRLDNSGIQPFTVSGGAGQWKPFAEWEVPARATALRPDLSRRGRCFVPASRGVEE